LRRYLGGGRDEREEAKRAGEKITQHTSEQRVFRGGGTQKNEARSHSHPSEAEKGSNVVGNPEELDRDLTRS
jgi:hypothetical protein